MGYFKRIGLVLNIWFNLRQKLDLNSDQLTFNNFLINFKTNFHFLNLNLYFFFRTLNLKINLIFRITIDLGRVL